MCGARRAAQNRPPKKAIGPAGIGLALISRSRRICLCLTSFNLQSTRYHLIDTNMLAQATFGALTSSFNLETMSGDWNAFESNLRNLFGLPAGTALEVSYFDEDGDKIAVSTGIELNDLMAGGAEGLRFDVSVLGGDGASDAWENVEGAEKGLMVDAEEERNAGKVQEVAAGVSEEPVKSVEVDEPVPEEVDISDPKHEETNAIEPVEPKKNGIWYGVSCDGCGQQLLRGTR